MAIRQATCQFALRQAAARRAGRCLLQCDWGSDVHRTTEPDSVDSTVALLAWIFYAHVGLAILRHAWLNLDWLWACVLVATGVVVLIV